MAVCQLDISQSELKTSKIDVVRPQIILGGIDRGRRVSQFS